MKVMVDTNIVLDLLLDRTPHAMNAAQIFFLIERNVIAGCLGTTVFDHSTLLVDNLLTKKDSMRGRLTL